MKSVTNYMERFFPTFHYFNRAVFELLHRTPSKLDMWLRRHGPQAKRNFLRICDLFALRPFPHIAQKTLYFLHSKDIRQITKTTVIFETRAIIVCCMRSAIQFHHKLPSSGSHTRNIITCCFLKLATWKWKQHYWILHVASLCTPCSILLRKLWSLFASLLVGRRKYVLDVSRYLPHT